MSAWSCPFCGECLPERGEHLFAGSSAFRGAESMPGCTRVSRWWATDGEVAFLRAFGVPFTTWPRAHAFREAVKRTARDPELQCALLEIQRAAVVLAEAATASAHVSAHGSGIPWRVARVRELFA